jgi:hypothetical protein
MICFIYNKLIEIEHKSLFYAFSVLCVYVFRYGVQQLRLYIALINGRDISLSFFVLMFQLDFFYRRSVEVVCGYGEQRYRGKGANNCKAQSWHVVGKVVEHEVSFLC